MIRLSNVCNCRKGNVSIFSEILDQAVVLLQSPSVIFGLLGRSLPSHFLHAWGFPTPSLLREGSLYEEGGGKEKGKKKIFCTGNVDLHRNIFVTEVIYFKNNKFWTFGAEAEPRNPAQNGNAASWFSSGATWEFDKHKIEIPTSKLSSKTISSQSLNELKSKIVARRTTEEGAASNIYYIRTSQCKNKHTHGVARSPL